jgi:hypothetical protein
MGLEELRLRCKVVPALQLIFVLQYVKLHIQLTQKVALLHGTVKVQCLHANGVKLGPQNSFLRHLKEPSQTQHPSAPSVGSHVPAAYPEYEDLVLPLWIQRFLDDVGSKVLLGDSTAFDLAVVGPEAHMHEGV